MELIKNNRNNKDLFLKFEKTEYDKKKKDMEDDVDEDLNIYDDVEIAQLIKDLQRQQVLYDNFCNLEDVIKTSK